MKDLEKLSTLRLLGKLKILRSRTVTAYWQEDFDSVQFKADKKEMEVVKKILATREHYPRGKAGRQLRMKERQNR